MPSWYGLTVFQANLSWIFKIANRYVQSSNPRARYFVGGPIHRRCSERLRWHNARPHSYSTSRPDAHTSGCRDAHADPRTHAETRCHTHPDCAAPTDTSAYAAYRNAFTSTHAETRCHTRPDCAAPTDTSAYAAYRNAFTSTHAGANDSFSMHGDKPP